MKENIDTFFKYIQFKPVFALTVTGLCFAFFFIKGVDNGIMVLCTLAAKHYFDSTASAVKTSQTLSETVNKQANDNNANKTV